eukprot:scaffold2514_cov226-Alexandrium_tamarense.AAC.14
MTCTFAFATIKRCQVMSLRKTAGWLLGNCKCRGEAYRFGSAMKGLIDLDFEVIFGHSPAHHTAPKSR